MLLKIDPCEKLFEMAMAFRESFGMIFSTSLPLFARTFFSYSNLQTIPEDSAVMLQINIIVGIGACIKNEHRLAETLIQKAQNGLQMFLSAPNELSDVDSLLVTDSLNFLACYYSSIGDLSKATYYNKEAYEVLERLASLGRPQLLNTNTYGNTIWTRLTYDPNLGTLENGLEWAKLRDKKQMMAYSLCLLISTLCTSQSLFNSGAQVTEQLQRLLLDLFSQLESTIETANFRATTSTEGSRTYTKLIDYGLNSMKCWLLGNHTKAGEYLEETALQAALFPSPSVEAFVPLYLASFVSLQLSQNHQVTFRDLTEIILLALVRIGPFRWARPIIDHHLNLFDSTMAWSGSFWSFWPKLQSY